ncbi:MAG: SNF2 helicase associated domain-containing protein, partial [Lachnospiraceae bacterium]|nr:SNF2 helicase associated domain-containing protein [Lachnospiraceae bacterium]
MEYFRKLEYRQLTPSYYHLEPCFQIPEFMKDQEAKAYVSFYAGQGKMYKISNTKKFIHDYYYGQTIRLGKEFCFIRGECEFDEQSGGVLDYMTEIYEVQKTLGKTYYSNLFNRQDLILSKGMLYKLLKLLTGSECSLKLYGKSFENVRILWENPKLRMNIALENDVLYLTDDNEERLYSLTEDGSILFFAGTVYLPDKDFIGNILPFYSTLFHETGRELEFRGENRDDFIEKVLPVIKKSIAVSVPEKIRESYVVEPLEAQLYLDIVKSKTKCYVSASILFLYGEYRVDPLKAFSAGNMILVRDKEEEERLTRILYDLNFKVADHSFLLKGEEDIFSLMTEKMSVLTDNFSVFYSKEYKNTSIGKLGQAGG